jgi:hypothetical protein
MLIALVTVPLLAWRVSIGPEIAYVTGESHSHPGFSLQSSPCDVACDRRRRAVLLAVPFPLHAILRN